MLRRQALAVLLSVAGPFAGTVAVAIAEPLDKESCANLQIERKKLLTREMQAALEHGPDWVKDHLDDRDRSARSGGFLSVEEQIVVPLPRRRAYAKVPATATETPPARAGGRRNRAAPGPQSDPAGCGTKRRRGSLAKRWRIRIRQRLANRRRQDDHCSSRYSRHGRHRADRRRAAAALRRRRARHWRRRRRLHDRPQRRQCADQDHGGACRVLLRHQPDADDPGEPAPAPPTSIFDQAGTPVQGGGGSLPGLVLPSAPKPASARQPQRRQRHQPPPPARRPRSRNSTADSLQLKSRNARIGAHWRRMPCGNLARNSAIRGWFGA